MKNRWIRIAGSISLIACFAGCEETTYECDVYQFGERIWTGIEFEAESEDAAEEKCEKEHDEAGVDCRYCKEK